MQNNYDLKRYAVLYVDDEEMALKYFEKAFGKEFRVITASNAADGLKLIEQQGDEIGVLLSDQRMPGEKGVQLLERVRLLRPRIVRMLITAYADFGVTVDAVNIGNIFRYISKPLQVEDMINTLRRAMEYFMLQTERDDLLREKLFTLQNMVITDRVISLSVIAAGLNRHLCNPLQAVQKFLQLIPGRLSQENTSLERLREPASLLDFHGQIVTQAERIVKLFGDPGNGVDCDNDTDAVFNQIAESFHKAFTEHGIQFHADIASPLPVLRADPVKFSKLFELLLKCELANLPKGSNASLSVKVAQQDEKPGSLHIEIRDNGSGLPEKTLRAVFDPFFSSTEDPQEFGLNLMGVYFLVYHHGGQISNHNTNGAGLNLNIDVPLSPPANSNANESSREFVTSVLSNDALWERLLPGG